MRYVFILLLSISCLISNVALARSVNTHPQGQSDRHRYTEYAMQLQATVKSHPPVSDCLVHLRSPLDSNFVDGVHITIHLSQEKLHEYLLSHAINLKDQDRYIENFRLTVRKSAQALFSEVKPSAILIEISVKP